MDPLDAALRTATELAAALGLTCLVLAATIGGVIPLVFGLWEPRRKD